MSAYSPIVIPSFSSLTLTPLPAGQTDESDIVSILKNTEGNPVSTVSADPGNGYDIGYGNQLNATNLPWILRAIGMRLTPAQTDTVTRYVSKIPQGSHGSTSQAAIYEATLTSEKLEAHVAGNRGRTEMTVKLASGALLVVLSGQALFVAPPVAYAQTATAPAASCAKQFPYGPEKFLAKLLAVADEADPHAVPATFQHVFEMKLPHAKVTDAQTFIYEAKHCDWYANVQIATLASSKSGNGWRVYLGVGDLPHPLLFVGSNGEECLSTDLATKSIEASGWQGGPLMGSIIVWGYRKGHALINFKALGSVTPNGPACVSEITVHYR